MPSQHPDLARQNRAKMAQSATFPTRLTAGQAATTAPTGPCDQPWAMFAVRVAAMPSASSQRAGRVLAPAAAPRTSIRVLRRDQLGGLDYEYAQVA